jgi:hypothetical protein
VAKKAKDATILLVPVGGEPELKTVERDVDSSSEFMGRWVGGTIASNDIGHRLHLICNDDGLALRLPYNRAGMVGPLLVGKYSPWGNLVSMSDADVAVAKAWLAHNDHRPPLCHVCGQPSGTTLFCPCRNVLIFCPPCAGRLEEVLRGDTKEMERFCVCERCRGQKESQP